MFLLSVFFSPTDWLCQQGLTNLCRYDNCFQLCLKCKWKLDSNENLEPKIMMEDQDNGIQEVRDFV